MCLFLWIVQIQAVQIDALIHSGWRRRKTKRQCGDIGLWVNARKLRVDRAEAHVQVSQDQAVGAPQNIRRAAASAGHMRPALTASSKSGPAKQRGSAKTATTAAAGQAASQYQAGELVFLAALIIFVIVHVIIAAKLPSQRESAKTATTAAAGQAASQYQAGELVFLAALILVVLLHIVIIITAAQLVGEGKRGQTAAAAAAGQAASQYQAGELVFLAALILVVVVVHILSFIFRFHYFAGKRQAGDFAPPPHPPSQKNLRQMAFLAIAVQAIFDFWI